MMLGIIMYIVLCYSVMAMFLNFDSIIELVQKISYDIAKEATTIVTIIFALSPIIITYFLLKWIVKTIFKGIILILIKLRIFK